MVYWQIMATRSMPWLAFSQLLLAAELLDERPVVRPHEATDPSAARGTRSVRE